MNLDSWTPEQVVSLQQMGNSRARAVYEANLPDNFRRPQNDSSLESFIRAKYEHKKYIAREWVPPTMPKVNWEKEIDEEIEKQKRRKKTVVEKKALSNVEVPQLPKPKNPSPKPGRVTSIANANANANANNSPETKQNADLLGLQNGEDNFSGFLSAPVTSAANSKDDSKSTTTTKKDDPDPIKSEEESFFNQPAPTEKEKAKLSKDSILALYGNAPPINNFQFQQPSNFSAFPHPQQNFPQNGVVAFPQPQQYQQQQFQRFPPIYNQWNAAQGGQFQFQNGPSSMPAQPTNMQMPASNFGANPAQFAPVAGHFPQSNPNLGGPNLPNPFFGSQPSSLQQQFASLSVNQNNAPNPAPTLSQNVWN